METCKRCGEKMKTINYRHVDFCNRMPLPGDLAREYVQRGVSYGRLAQEYDCSVNAMRHRILFGLTLLETQPDCQAAVDEDAGPSGDEVEELPILRCACEIILKTPAQRARGTCDFCAGETFDYMAFRQEETAAMRSIPMDASLSI